MKKSYYWIFVLMIFIEVIVSAAESDNKVVQSVYKPDSSDIFYHALAGDILAELVSIDTTPTNGSTVAAKAMAARLKSAGYPDSDVMLFGPRPDRHNLVVRLRGRSQAKPILFISHLDVVTAPRDGWQEGLDPFRLTERNGYFYGRGVLDNKHAGAGLIANLIRLRTEKYLPYRDIIVALTADEETGTANGIGWLLSEQRSLMDVAYCLNLDSGGGHIEKGAYTRISIQTSEKSYLSFRVETKSAGGHSSLPGKDNAIYRLAAGLTRLSTFEFPYRFNETTRAYFARLSKFEKNDTAADLAAISKDAPDLEAAKRIAALSPYNNAILHTTCVATRMDAGHADNALPQTARAILNCRVFPGDTLEYVQKTLSDVLADPQIQLTSLGLGQPSPVTPLLPEVLEPVEKICQIMWPGVPVVPTMDPWASDSVRMRRAGKPTFGVSGIFSDDDGNAHGANERLSAKSFYEGVDFLYRLIRQITAD